MKKFLTLLLFLHASVAMSQAQVKVLVGEVNGSEFDTPTERLLEASDMAFSDGTFTATNAKAAIIEAGTRGTVALEQPRYSFVFVHNGTLSNGQAVRWGNLTNDAPIVVPKKSQIREITFSNSSANTDAQFRFYKNTVSAPNLFFTWSFTNSQTAFATNSSFSSQPTFDPGDKLEVVFDDTGDNPSDTVMVIFLQAVP